MIRIAELQEARWELGINADRSVLGGSTKYLPVVRYQQEGPRPLLKFSKRGINPFYILVSAMKHVLLDDYSPS